MASIENAIFCDGCGVEITWSPVFLRNTRLSLGLLAQRPLRFCCQACAQGLPCNCAERMELEEERRKSPISTASYE